MAKLSVFPKCYIEDIAGGRMSIFEWMDLASTLPVDGIEMYDRFLSSLAPSYLAEVRQAAEERGLETPMMCCSPDFSHPDQSVRRAEIEKEKEIIGATAALGGEFCRVLSGQRHPSVPVEQGVKWVVEAICECLPTAEACGVTLVIENHYKDGFWEHPEFAQKSEVFLSIIDKIDSPFFGVQFDPSNAIVAGEDPLALLEIVRDRVKTMHASDRFLAHGATLDDLKQADGTIGYSPKLCHGEIGKGLNDYDAIFNILKEVNFDGWISIEDGMNGMDELRESALFLRRKMLEFGLSPA